MTFTDPSTCPAALQPRDGKRADVALFLKGSGPGGVERIALHLVTGWRDAGLQVALTLAHPSDMFATDPVARPWPVVGLRWPLARLTLRAWREMRRDPPAILFCPGNSYSMMAVLLRLLLVRRCPPIVAKVSNDLVRHDLHPAIRSLYHIWLMIQGRAIDHFAVLSAPMADEVVRVMRVAPGRVHVVPNPVLVGGRAGVARSIAHSAGRRFVAVGRLERQKDYPAMLRAFAAGSGPADRLAIYGEGQARAVLTRMAASLGVADRVRFHGHCPDVRDRLHQHDILLLSSRYEGLPGAVVEALSAGLNIIATRCCASMADLLDQGALGTLVECGDETAFACAIADARPGQQDRVRAWTKTRGFTIEAAVPAYMALFTTVIARRQARDRHRPSRLAPSTRPA